MRTNWDKSPGLACLVLLCVFGTIALRLVTIRYAVWFEGKERLFLKRWVSGFLIMFTCVFGGTARALACASNEVDVLGDGTQCEACTACAATNASCSVSVVNNVCTYTTACNTGYGNIQNNGAYNASCSANSYTITYTMNNGTNYENAPQTYTYGTGASINGIPTRSGYVFTGWTGSNGATPQLSVTISSTATGNRSYTANWVQCTACAATNASCSVSVVNNVCTYTTTCNTGYGNIQNNGEYNASCSETSCNGANFYDSALEACTPCPNEYNYNKAPGKTDVSQCQVQCPAGTYVKDAGIYGYTRLEYLESKGEQYINTGFVHNSANIRGEVRVGSGNTALNKNINILGNQVTGGGYSLGWAPSEFKLWLEANNQKRLSNATYNFPANTVYDLVYEFTSTNRYLSVNGGEPVNDKKIINVMGNGNNKGVIHLFDNGLHEKKQNFIGRIYYIRLYEDGELVHNFVPVKENATELVGIYDTVTGRFFVNSGTGEFIYGNDITDVCVNAGLGHYAESSVVNFGDTSTRTACPVGTYSDIETGESLASCISCPGTTYNGGTGASVCSVCPTGYNYNTTPGKTAVTQCQIHCEGGQYLPTTMGSDYTELKYIQTTGTQYIDTGVSVSSLTDPIMSMTLEYLDTTEGKQTGAYTSANNVSFKFGISNNGDFLCQESGTGTETLFGPADTNKHTFILNSQNATCTLDDNSKNLTTGDLSGLTGHITIGAVDGQVSRIGNVKIYRFELISNNTVIRSMIPVRRKSDGAIGMYDTVNQQFYPNDGTGVFVAGDDVNIPSCTDVGLGFWAPESVTNYGGDAPRTPCATGKTTMVPNASSASQCVDEIQEYDVTYSCGYGTGTPPETGLAKEESLFTPATNTCSRANYVFMGWGVSGTNDVKSDSAAFIWEYDEDKTFTAQWSECPACAAINATCQHTGIVNNVCTYTTACNANYGDIQNNGQYNVSCTPNTYTISYVMNDGINYENAPESYTYGIGATINGVPTKVGNIFAGWCTDSGLQNCAMTQTIGNNAMGDKTFYAKWTECTACAATNATCSLSVENNACVYTTTCNMNYGNMQNSGAYNASCTLNTYTVTYSCGDGGGTPPVSETAAITTLFTPAVSTCSWPGHTFAGWTVSDTQDTKYAGTSFTWAYNENKTFTAEWTTNVISITWQGADATDVENSGAGSCIYGGDLVTPTNAPVRHGYTFTGWNFSAPMAGQ